MMHRNRHRRRVVPQIVRLIWHGVQAIAKARMLRSCCRGEDRGCFAFIAREKGNRTLLLPSPHSPHGIKSSRILWLPPFKGGREGDGG